MHSLTDQRQVGVKRACARPHTIHISRGAGELYTQVCHSIVEDFHVHLALNRSLFRLCVREGWIDADRPHSDLGVTLTREWDLKYTVEISKERG